MNYYDINSKNLENISKNSQAIKESVRNILMTPVGSMPGMPDFGSYLFTLLFDPLDDILESAAFSYTRDALAKWEPRIYNINVIINMQPEYNRVTIKVLYNLVDTNEQDSTTLNLRQ